MITVVLALAAASTLAAQLQSRDQALLDAIAVGDRGTWERTLTPDAIYVDENGATMSRSQLMADFDPGTRDRLHRAARGTGPPLDPRALSRAR